MAGCKDLVVRRACCNRGSATLPLVIVVLAVVLGACASDDPVAAQSATVPASSTLGCPDLDETYGGDVTIWLDESGACASVDAVFEFACAPGGTGWINLGGTDGSRSDVRQFVPAEEGRALSELPDDAESLLMRHGDRELYLSPSQPGSLYVVTPTEVHRYESGTAACG